MTDITKKISKHVAPGSRYQYWASSENADDGTPIAAGDIFQIFNSLGKPAHYMYIETAAGTVLSIRLNSQTVRFPLRDRNTHWALPSYDLENPIVETDSTMDPMIVGADEVFELDGVLSVSDIQIVTFSAGSFILFVS